MNPQSENNPINQSVQLTSQPKDSHGITIAAMALFVLLSLAAVAFLYYQNQQLKTLLASYHQSQVSPTPTATTDVTANWKTYTDTKLGFTFKYPSDYFKYSKVQSSGVTVGTSQRAAGNDTTSPLVNTDVWFYVSTETPVEIIPETPNSQTQVTVDGQVAKEIINKTSGPIVWFSKNGINFVIALSYKDPTTSKQSETLFNQILSTFKFILSSPNPAVFSTSSPSAVPNVTY